MRYWKRVKDNVTTTVESYSHDQQITGAIEITKAEFDTFVAECRQKQPPPINWKQAWKDAVELEDKLTVIAKKLNLK